MKIILIVLILISGITLLGCSDDNSTAEPTKTVTLASWDNIIYDLPSSISETSATSSKAVYSLSVLNSISSTSPDFPVVNIYNGVRGIVGWAEAASVFARKLMIVFNSIHTQQALFTGGETVPFEYTVVNSSNTGDKIKLSVSPSSLYSWEVQVWRYRDSVYMKALDSFYTIIDDHHAKGVIYLDIYACNGGTGYYPYSYAEILFDNSDDNNKKLTLSVEGLTQGGTTTVPGYIPEKVIVSCYKDSNSIINVSGNAWLPNITGTNSHSLDSSHYGDVIISYVGGNYIFKGVADYNNDQAKVWLAISKDTRTDTTNIFGETTPWDATDDSVGNTYAAAITNYINGSSGSGSTGGPRPDLITIMNSFTPSSSITVSSIPTVTEIRNWFEWYTTNSYGAYDAKIAGLAFAFKLVNPGYFENSGFIGNSMVGTVPSWSNSFNVSSSLQLYTPAEIKILDVYNRMDHSAPSF